MLTERYGKKVRLKLFSSERGFPMRRGSGMAGAIGAAFADSLLGALEDGALRDRYRL